MGLKSIFPQLSPIWIFIIFFLTTNPHASHGTTFDETFTSAKHFIDKTSLLKEFFKNTTQAFLTAPRGFGKTTNLRMIQKFSQIEFDDKGNTLAEDQSTSNKLFKSLTVGLDGNTMSEHLAQHPVIFFDMEFRIDGEITKDKILRAYSAQLNETYSQYQVLIKEHSNDHSIYTLQAEKYVMKKVATEVLEEFEIKEGIRHLAYLLNAYFNKSVVLLIDNYDSIIHNSFVESKGCIDYVYSILEEMLFKCYQYDSQVVKYTMIASVTNIGFQCFGFHRFLNQQFSFYDNHDFAPYFGLSEPEVDDLNLKSGGDKSTMPTIRKYCGGYEIKNLTQVFYNTSCVIDYLKTNDNFTWINHQNFSEPSKFLWKLFRTPEYLDQVSRLIKISPIRHGRNDLISFTNFTKIIHDDFNETKFFSGVNSSTFSYMIQTGLLTPIPGRNAYIMPNLRARKQFMTDLFYYYEKIANIDLQTVGIRLGEFFTSEKNYTGPRTNLMECLTTAFGKLPPMYSPCARNTTKRKKCSSDYIYQSIIHLGGLTNQQIQVIEDFPQPVSLEKSSSNTIRRCVTSIEKDGVALIIKVSDQISLEPLMTHGHKYDIEKRDDLDLVVYLAIYVDNDNRVLIDVKTSKFTDEISGNTTYHYVTSIPKKTKATKIKQNGTKFFKRGYSRLNTKPIDSLADYS